MSKIIDPDIRSTIDKLDQRIAKLRKIREMLLDTRKQQIVDFLLKSGSARRKDIVSGTNIPMGTVSFALNDKKTFHSVNGKWDVVESLKSK